MGDQKTWCALRRPWCQRIRLTGTLKSMKCADAAVRLDPSAPRTCIKGLAEGIASNKPTYRGPLAHRHGALCAADVHLPGTGAPD
jgi:hypothetical protein